MEHSEVTGVPSADRRPADRRPSRTRPSDPRPSGNGVSGNGVSGNGVSGNGVSGIGVSDPRPSGNGATVYRGPLGGLADALANGHGPMLGPAAVLVPTHNDGANIAALLERLLAEPAVGEIIVVASGCDDETVPLVSEAATGDSRVQLFVEAERSGKFSAVNFGLDQIGLPYVVIVSGDVMPAAGAIGLLVEALEQPGVGLAGGRPVPDNSESTAMGHASHLLWRLHHRLALQQPKLGEMLALRAEAVVSLPRTSVDEACFQALLEGAGWKARYVPDAVVANRGPCTVADFVRQRRQIHTGHLWLRHSQHYSVPSLHLGLLLREFWQDLTADPRRRRPRPLALTASTVALEAAARLLARLDYVKGRENVVWAMVKSTKGGMDTGATSPEAGSNGLGPRHL